MANPIHKDSSKGVPTLSIPCSAISLSTNLDIFYLAQQCLQRRRGLTRGIQGRDVRTKFSTVGKEDMGIERREIVTYLILIEYQNITSLFKEHHSASSINYNNLKAIDHIDIAGRGWITSIICHFNKTEPQHHNRSVTVDKDWAIHITSYINLVQICHIT